MGIDENPVDAKSVDGNPAKPVRRFGLPTATALVVGSALALTFGALSNHSIVFDQAEKRLHTIKAVLVAAYAG